jgi:hypothetical protein
MNSLLEIPLISATTLDGAFGTGGSAIRKYRQTIRKTLDPGIQFSIGKAGTVRLSTVASLACIATAGRWKLKDADRLVSVYKKAGLTDLINSKDYGDALKLARQALQAEVRSFGTAFSRANITELIPKCLAGLTATEPVLRSVALSIGTIMKKVDEQLPQMKRLPGQIVRVEGPEALIVVDTGEREELRTVDSEYLKSLGLQESGAQFILHEFSWSPDSKMFVFFPAMDLERTAGATAALEAELKALEKPLAKPTWDLVKRQVNTELAPADK